MNDNLAVLIPIIALSIPAIALIFRGMQRLAKLRIEEIKARGGTDSLPEIDNLRSDIEQLRQELGEVHERLDFTERLLARKEKAGLGEGQNPQ